MDCIKWQIELKLDFRATYYWVTLRKWNIEKYLCRLHMFRSSMPRQTHKHTRFSTTQLSQKGWVICHIRCYIHDLAGSKGRYVSLIWRVDTIMVLIEEGRPTNHSNAHKTSSNRLSIPLRMLYLRYILHIYEGF